MEITEEELQKKLDEAIAEAKKGLLTQEQVNEVVSKRITEINEKHKKELEEKEKVAQMSAEEKQKHDFDELTKERDTLKASLAEKEHREKLTALMADKKIDSSFYDMFSGVSDLEKAGGLMDKFNTTFEEKLNAAVEKKINPHVPSKGNETTNDSALRKAMGL